MEKEDKINRCVNCFIKVIMEYNPKGIAIEYLDDLYFIEIIMEAEKEFDISIDEGVQRISDFNTLEDVMKWIIGFTNQTLV